MIYKFKYKLIKNLITKYFDIRVLNFGVANENTLITLDVDNEMCRLIVNEHEDACVFNIDEKFIRRLEILKQKFILAKTVEYLSENDYITITDGDFEFNIKAVSGFGFPAVIIGEGGYLLASPIVGEYDDNDIEGIVFALNKYESDRGFPDYRMLKIKIREEILASLSFELLDTNLFEGEIYEDENRD